MRFQKNLIQIQALKNINDQEFDRFTGDLNKLSRSQEVLDEEQLSNTVDRFSNMSKEDLMKELEDMFYE